MRRRNKTNRIFAVMLSMILIAVMFGTGVVALAAESRDVTVDFGGSKKVQLQVIRKASAANGLQRDLGPFITNTKFEKNNNGNWEQTTSFSDGDTARFTIYYKVESGKLNADDILTYQLDKDHIVIQSDQSGRVTDENGTEIGDYSVTMDGKITINFDESFDISKGFEGKISFQGMVSTKGSSENTEVRFGANGSFTITPPPAEKTTDLTAGKSGYVGQDGKLHFTINVSSTKGTDGVINLYDYIDGDALKSGYEFGTPTVTKRDAQGNTSNVNGVTWSQGSEDHKHTTYKLSQLPKLNAGESYSIEYTVDPKQGYKYGKDGALTLKNQAVTWDNTDNKYPSCDITIQNQIVSKYAEWDNTNRKINWTITINNPAQTDVTQHVFRDELKDREGKPIQLPSTVKIRVTDPAGSTEEYDLTVNPDGTFSFPAGFNATAKQYKITYSTAYSDILNGKDNNSAINTFHYGEYEAGTGEIWVGKRTADVTKKLDEHEDLSDGTTKLNWTSVITIPEDMTDLTPIEYTDTMTMYQGNTSIEDVHYTTPELLSRMTIQNEAGETLTAGTDYQIFSSDGKTNITNSSSEEHITSYTVKFLPADKINGHEKLTLNYNTIAAFSSQPANTTWQVRNKGRIPGHEQTATFDHYNDYVIDKQASATGKPNDGDCGDGYFTNDGISVSYKNGVIYYRVLIKVPAGTTSELVLYDQLQEGLTFDAEAGVKVFHHNAGSQDNLTNYGNRLAISGSASQPEGSSQVTFTIPYKTGKNQYGNDASTFQGGDVLAIYYQAKIDDAAYWGDNSHKEKNYVNNVTFGSLSDSTTTTVKKTAQPLTKDGVLVDEGSGRYRIDYSLVLNEYADDLDPNSHTLTLKDALSVDKADTEAAFDPTSLKVYEYSAAAENHQGNELNESRYQMQYDSQTCQLTLTVPDELAMVVCYSYSFKVGGNTTKVSNAASLNGVANSSKNEEQKLRTSDSSASAWRKEVTVYKVDSSDNKIRLKGVTFKLEKFTESGTWEKVDVKASLTTDQNGSIHLIRSDNDLKDGVVYRLTETNVGDANAAVGYQMSDKPYYFCWKTAGNESMGAEQYYNSLVLKDKLNAAGIGYDKIDFMNYTGTIYVPNEKKAITVNKVWLNADNADLNDPTKTATVQLYKIQKAQHTVTVRVTGNGGEKTYSTPVASGSTVTIYIADNNDPNKEELTLQGISNTYQGGWKTGPDGTSYSNYVVAEGLGPVNTDTTFTFTGSQWVGNGNIGTITVVETGGSGSSGLDSYIEVGDPVVLKASNGWSHTWVNLEDGLYCVQETPISGFTMTYSDNNTSGISSGTITVTNKSDKKVQYESFSLKKKWVDAGGNPTDWKGDIEVILTGTRKRNSEGNSEESPQEIASKFTIHRNDDGSFTAAKEDISGKSPIASYTFVQPTVSDNVYSFRFENLPYGENDDPYVYTLTESAAGYYAKYCGADGNAIPGASHASSGQLVQNTPNTYVLPATGGRGTGMQTALGTILVFLGAALMLLKKKRV